MRHLEDSEQAALFQWAGYIPELKWMHAIANGGKRNIREAARLKRQGVKSGVSDIFLPLPRGGNCGLYIEMKRSKGRISVSKNQKQFMIDMSKAGYKAVICKGFDDAKNVINEYLMSSIR